MSNLQKNDNLGENIRSICRFHTTCSGCQLWEIPWGQQKSLKISALESLFLKNNIHSSGASYQGPAPFGLRDRLDFTYENGALGLYHKKKRQVVDLPECLQLSPNLQNWLSEFRLIKWPLQKASFRLRVSPSGQKGVWIDCANVDIKNLLEEGSQIRELQKVAFVEIGQRRKVPVERKEVFKLEDPVLNPWFETWLDETTSLPLYCQVASFTQPSYEANKITTRLIRRWVQESKGQRVIEFGSGIGNLTFPALATASELCACEIDKGALEGLKQSLEELPPKWRSLKDKIQIYAGDFQRKIQSDFSKFDIVLANPPRSGLMNFLNSLQKLSAEKRPSTFIYMSCFPESLCVDLVRLQEMGYKMQETVLLDQFPQSEHSEVLCLLKK